MCCIVVDFDGTLAHFAHGSQGFFKIFTQRRVPESVVQEGYEQLKTTEGFSMQGLTALLEKKFSFKKEGTEQEFEEWLQQELVLYPESIEAIQYWKGQNIPVVILTAGQESFQREKVDMMKIPYDKLCIVPSDTEKVVEIKNLMSVYGKPIAVIDDKATILDMIRSEFPDTNEVKTIWIRRSEPSVQKTEYEHMEISDLQKTTLNSIEL
tara:strand:- start:4 stop:630 length:627 start_codon:yes stop_codon:yes gene_type:complete